MEKVCSDVVKEHDRPSPCAFDRFLPWACCQLQVEANILVTKAVQQEYVSATHSHHTDKSRSRRFKIVPTPSRSDPTEKISKIEYSSSRTPIPIFIERNVKILTTYDNNENLIRIKFQDNTSIPPKIIKVISLIIQFHPYLSTVIINCGLDTKVMDELAKLLYLSHITYICLDNTYFNEATYYILLEKKSLLKQLSLARCRINDDVIKKMASKLKYPSPASQTLCILNLTSNRITDAGAKYLGEALRTNRCLNYINLADNAIGDDGADFILNSLMEFPIRQEEQHKARSKYMEFLKAKKDLMTRMLEAVTADFDKKAMKRKSIKPPVTANKKTKALDEYTPTKSAINVNDMLMEKAKTMAQNAMGEFNHAYSNENTVLRDGITYCSGNNTLSYLNLAYNNLSYYSVTKLLRVLKVQKLNGKKPRGLVNVRIEGNCLPISCEEFREIDEILEGGLIGPGNIIKKKPPTRGGKSY